MTGLVKLHDRSSHHAKYGSPFTKLGHTCTASHLRVGHKLATVGAEKRRKKRTSQSVLEEQVIPVTFLWINCAPKGTESVSQLFLADDKFM